MVYLHHFFSLFLGKAKEILSHLNWVDLIGIILVIRTCYIGLRKGLLIEIFKFSGFAVGIFVAVTQYRAWGATLAERGVFALPQAEMVAFLVIFGAVYAASIVLRFLLEKVATIQIRGAWDRLGGGLLGVARGCLWVMVLEVAALCVASTTGYLAHSIREKSFFGPSLLTGGKVTYQIANQFSTSFSVEKFEKILQENYSPPSSPKKK